jgi:hypothetical protein
MPYLRLDTGHWPIGLSAVRFKEVSARFPDKSAQVDDDFAFALGKFARKQRLPNPGETPRHKQLHLVGLSLRIALGLVVALVGWNCGGAFSARATDQQSINGAAARLSSEVPFQLSAGFLILVEGRVGPMTPLTFILDTGATHTVVDGKLADELSLPRRKGKVLNFDKDLTVDWTNLPELQVGPMICCETLGLDGADFCRGYIQHFLKTEKEIPNQSAARIQRDRLCFNLADVFGCLFAIHKLFRCGMSEDHA